MKIGEVMRKWRVVNERNLRDVAREIGIGAATLLRIEQGKMVDGKTILKVISWLFDSKT